MEIAKKLTWSTRCSPTTGSAEDDMRLHRGALLEVIRHYTRESGVRGLERELASIARKVARDKVSQGEDSSR